MADMLRGQTFDGQYLHSINDLLQAVAFAVRSTVITHLNHSPAQLVFNRDMILDIQQTIDWKLIHNKRESPAVGANIAENKKRVPHVYQPGNKVLLFVTRKSKLGKPTEGPYTILEVYDNGTIEIQRDSYTETINIRRVKPFME